MTVHADVDVRFVDAWRSFARHVEEANTTGPKRYTAIVKGYKDHISSVQSRIVLISNMLERDASPTTEETALAVGSSEHALLVSRHCRRRMKIPAQAIGVESDKWAIRESVLLRSLRVALARELTRATRWAKAAETEGAALDLS